MATAQESRDRGVRPITIDAVAAACGVSKATVSKALNPRAGVDQISLATRTKIEAVAIKLGYQPARIRQEAARRRRQAVGLLFGRHAPMTGGGGGDIIEAAALALDAVGQRLLLVPVRDDREDWHARMRDQRIDGLLVVDPQPPDLRQILDQVRLPTVIINHPQDFPTVGGGWSLIDHVDSDEIQGAQLAVQHLHALGHRRIAWVMLPRAVGHPSESLRRSGYEQAMRSVGGEPLFVSAPPEELSELLRRSRATAAIAYNAHDALRLQTYLRRADWQLPRQLSVVCFDDVAALDYADPALTAVRVPFADMAQWAVDLLTRRLNRIEAQPPQRILMPQSLVVRASTAALGANRSG